MISSLRTLLSTTIATRCPLGRETPGSPHLGRYLLSLNSAGLPLEQTAIENALLKVSFKHKNALHRVKKRDALLVENKVRLGLQGRWTQRKRSESISRA